MSLPSNFYDETDSHTGIFVCAAESVYNVQFSKNVIFSNPGDVIDFVKIVEKYPFDMDMKRGRYIVDAKSLLGLMNLGFDQKIELKVYDEECDDLWKELDKFVAA